MLHMNGGGGGPESPLNPFWSLENVSDKIASPSQGLFHTYVNPKIFPFRHLSIH